MIRWVRYHGEIGNPGQERFGARVILSEADWNLLETDAGGWPKATRDMVATDGQTLTLGDTTLTFYMTPGHTLGTISTIVSSAPPACLP